MKKNLHFSYIYKKKLQKKRFYCINLTIFANFFIVIDKIFYFRIMDNAWYDDFLDILNEKYPKKGQLTQELMDLLSIEREAVYRRLRKEVLFPINEVVKIASKLGLSLDEITGLNSDKVSFLMQPINYLKPTNEDTSYMKRMIKLINNFRNSPNSEYMEICNKLPRSLTSGFQQLRKFSIFKWNYQYGEEKINLPYSKINITKPMQQTMLDFYLAMKNISQVSYIFDNMLFDYLVGDIRYFHAIQMITDEDKELLKEEISNLIDYLYLVTNIGAFPETRNTVNFYISQINIDTNYSYLYTDNYKVFRIHVFNKYETKNYDPETVSKFRTWMQLKKRSTIQISAVDEKSRIEYFDRQRILIESL